MEGARVRGLAFGMLPGRQQSVSRAELYAVIVALRNGQLPLRVRADMNAIGEDNNGKELRPRPRRPKRDLLEVLWRALEGRGGLPELMAIACVKARQSETSMQQHGNDCAGIGHARRCPRLPRDPR